MELPNRKQIRLKEYDYSQNNVYFITICTYNRENLFGENVGATLCGRPNRPDKMIEKWLSELQNKYSNVLIDKYVIMPDHVHLILQQTGDTTDGLTEENAGDHAGSPLPKIINWFKTMTTNEYIKGVKTNLYPPFCKHIWQRNYYEHVIRNQEDYNEIWKYIDENPLKSEIEKLIDE